MLSCRRILTKKKLPLVSSSSWQHHSLLPSSSSLSSEKEEHQRNHHQPSLRQQHRLYHATQKREILPLIALGTVVFVGRYAWKAKKRMDEEWEEYEWELKQYEKHRARSNPNEDTSKAIAIDMGSLYTKFATSHPKPDVVVSREGDRSFFNGVIYDGDDAMIRSRAALERFFYLPYDAGDGYDEETVKLPWAMLNDPVSQDAGKKTVSDSLEPALKETLDRIDYKPDLGQPLRMIVTAPVHQLHSDTYATTFAGLLPSEPPVVLPDPVASVWGAQTRGLIPSEADSMKPTTLVVDVGGSVTQVAIVKEDVILHSVIVPWGGESFVHEMVQLLLKESKTPLKDARSLSALQFQARTAVAELTNKTRASIHVPYLFPDPGNHHLDTSMSRAVLEQAIHTGIRDHLPYDLIEGVFSPHLPNPNDLSSFFTSIITDVLEKSHQMPSNISHVLLVGGGAKPPMVAQNLKSALFTLMGSEGAAKVVMPEGPLLTEVTVLGAATMLPSYEYSPQYGLQRI